MHAESNKSFNFQQLQKLKNQRVKQHGNRHQSLKAVMMADLRIRVLTQNQNGNPAFNWKVITVKKTRLQVTITVEILSARGKK